MARRCFVVSGAPGGVLCPMPSAGDYVIAADAGYRVCTDAGVRPDLLVADFDSLGGVRGRIECECIELPEAKDETDTLAALREGLARGYDEFLVPASLGGDLGHELANVQCLLFLEENGAHGTLYGNGQLAFVVTPAMGEVPLGAEVGQRVSVFALAGDASGVNERGLRWELEDADLTCTFPYGVSNEAVAAEQSVSVGEGTLLVVVGQPDACGGTIGRQAPLSAS